MTLSWGQIARLGLVQMCLGAVVVLTTSTLNRRAATGPNGSLAAWARCLWAAFWRPMR